MKIMSKTVKNPGQLDKEGDEEIREIQKELNSKYHDVIGIIPTNGIYDKQTNEALRKVIKKELDLLEKNND